MGSQVWVVATLLVSIVLIVLTIVKLKFHPFLALLLASFFVGAMMGMSPLDMVNAIESGIGGTLGFLAAVIGLGTILGKMMEVSGQAPSRSQFSWSLSADGVRGTGRVKSRWRDVWLSRCYTSISTSLKSSFLTAPGCVRPS